MPSSRMTLTQTLPADALAGLVVFIVALPLCLGVAMASNAPLISGVIAGVVGGLVVGLLSGSHTSVSGPSPGATAVIAAQLAALGSFEAFLLAVVVGGLIQIVLGLLRAGVLSAFFPSAVIKGLLCAIGIILILKQVPHLLGRDTDPEGDMSFFQPDRENTFSEFGMAIQGFLPGAALIGLTSVVLMLAWDRWSILKQSRLPAPLVVVLFGVGLNELFRAMNSPWLVGASHLVQVPVATTFAEFANFLRVPDFTQWANPAIYSAGLTIAIMASLETLLNIEAVDQIDPKQRQTPASQELIAQGVGNTLSGLIGGIPLTSVIVRSSVNINAGAQTKMAAIFHGVLLLVCVALLPQWLNLVPLASLAAILFVTGMKLADPSQFRVMWQQGQYQFLPFMVTLVAIVLTDLVTGVLIGLALSLSFILKSNLRRPLKRIHEKHLTEDVLRIELANQVSFLNRAALERTLRSAESGTHILLDARNTDYIDPDILTLIRDFKEKTAPVRGVQVSLRGFRQRYHLRDEIQFVDFSTRAMQDKLTGQQVLQILREGNERFRNGQPLARDLTRQVLSTAPSQHPLAVVLSCIDSRTPAELLFDLGLGDIFSIRIAGNVASPKILGSMEYGCAVAGAKLILVMGHTRCGAVTAAVTFACSRGDIAEVTGCQNLEPILTDIQRSVDQETCQLVSQSTPERKAELVDAVARRNVETTIATILDQSDTIRNLVEEGRVEIAGAIYDVQTGHIDFIEAGVAV